MASPVLTNLRRLPSNASVNSGSTKHEEDLINAYEAEEERIINVLSRKLEQVSLICSIQALILHTHGVIRHDF
jgi:hypothetical protein